MNSYMIIGIITLIIIFISYIIDKNNIDITNISNISLSVVAIFTAIFTALKNVKNDKTLDNDLKDDATSEDNQDNESEG